MMVTWTVETLDEDVNEEIEALPASLRARIVRLLEMVEAIGLDRMREPHVKHLDGKLWELRAKAAEGIARAICVTVSGRKVIVLHVFAKKSQKTPPRSLQLARERMKRVVQ